MKRALWWAISVVCVLSSVATADDDARAKAAQAAALSHSGRSEDLARAVALAREACWAAPDDVRVLELACDVFGAADDKHYRSCVKHLLALAPDSAFGNYLAADIAATAGNYRVARRRLEHAHAMGMPDEYYARVDQLLREHELPILPRRVLDVVLWVALCVALPWLAILGILYAIGRALSRKALRALDDPEALAPNVRRWSRIVLAASGVYFYLSLPMLVVGVMSSTAVAIMGFLYFGRTPLLPLITGALAVIATFVGAVFALLVRPSHDDLGREIDLVKHSRLRTLLQEVAAKVGTAPPDSVYLAPGTTLTVEERASLWSSIRRAKVERRLIMGVGLFEDMTQLQLRSLLAHEHGHYRNPDTAGGGFALRVRHALVLASSAYGEFNPASYFLHIYQRMYFAISEGASRIQETLADRCAIRAYGSKAFVDGYRHVALRTVELAYRAEAIGKEAVEIDMAAEIEKELSREPDRYDSHPSPKQRIAWAEALAVERAPEPGDDAPVWDLFEDREQLEELVTGDFRRSLAVRIPAA